MMKYKLSMSIGIMLAITTAGISGCSAFKRGNEVAVDEKLIIPPSLKVPVRNTSKSVRRNQPRIKTASYSNKNYYVVVGTYPSQEQAFDTFVRLSSIGLPGATMESRKTRAGKNLHMVRLGPYQKQEDIDKVKDSLTSDGLSQFKVVEN